MTTHRRFDRTARLLGDDGLARLATCTVAVIGCGGVGSHAAEALVRSGVGRLILVDFDRICVTNTNRQLHAMKGSLGKSKVQVMAERLAAINPDAQIVARNEFYSEKTSAQILCPEPDLIIDAIDNITAKLHLIMTCRERKLRLVSSMGAAARMDPTRVRVVDLSETYNDPFAYEIRRHLRRKHAVDTSRPLGVHAVFSDELPIEPRTLAYDNGGFRCVCPSGDNGMHSCEHRNRVEGSMAFVPAAFGLAAAATAVRLLVGTPARVAPREHAHETVNPV
ncbi:MAG: tRNA threonylcarbamoyladenosine dehydratase [Deltaproteobacteria bacterium]|nr:tRNA threonylcarbamoyladenosine dehydratase [Deltaproteobacteria bacterium]